MEAAELFLRDGVQAVSMTQIARECDLGVATLYRYFGTKSGIVVAAGALLWSDLKRLFEGIFAQDGYRRKGGMEQIEELLGFILMLYREHQPFLRFVKEFDDFVLAEKLSAEDLADYEKSVLDLFPLFRQAYEKACREGTARPGLDAELLYSSVSHALMSTSQKFLQGDILSSDAKSDKTRELELLADISLRYLRV